MQPTVQDKMKYQRFLNNLIADAKQEIAELHKVIPGMYKSADNRVMMNPNDKETGQRYADEVNRIIDRHHNNVDILRQAFLGEHPDITEGHKILRHHRKYGAITT